MPMRGQAVMSPQDQIRMASPAFRSSSASRQISAACFCPFLTGSPLTAYICKAKEISLEFWDQFSSWSRITENEFVFFTSNFFALYEGPLGNYWHPLAFWTLGKIKKFCSWQSKEGRLKCRKREKKVSCIHARRQAIGLWSKAGANCTHLTNESIKNCIFT